MPKLRGLAVVGFVLLAAGCSSGPSTPVPSAAPTSPAETASSTPASAGKCPDGAYLVTELEGRGSASAVGKGTGGNIAADFDDGRLTITSDGSEPVKVDLGPTNAELRFNGEITGTYSGDPDALKVATTGAHGDVSVKGFGITRSYSAGGLADQLIGRGATAQVTCDDAGTAVVVLPNASLTLTRQ